MDKTFVELSNKYHWQNTYSDTKEFRESCELCQLTKSSTQKPVGLFAPLNVPTRPWIEIAIDFLFLKQRNVPSDISFVTRFPRKRFTVFPQLVWTIVQSLKDFPGVFHLGITYPTHSVLNLASNSPRVDNLFNLIVVFLILIQFLWFCSISE